jgi:hypothetical protein
MNAPFVVAITGQHGGGTHVVPQPVPPQTVISREYYSTQAPSGYVVAADLSMPVRLEKDHGDIPGSVWLMIGLGVIILITMAIRSRA